MRELPIGQENLRFQLERGLKDRLIQLREGYLLADGDPGRALELMLRALPGFQVLLRASLRFYAVNVPPRERLAAGELQKHVSFDLSIFDELQGLKDADSRPSDRETVAALFRRYLRAAENAADLMGQLGRR